MGLRSLFQERKMWRKNSRINTGTCLFHKGLLVFTACSKRKHKQIISFFLCMFCLILSTAGKCVSHSVCVCVSALGRSVLLCWLSMQLLCVSSSPTGTEDEKWLIPPADLNSLRGSTVSWTISFGKSAYEASRQLHWSTQSQSHTHSLHKTHFSSHAQGRLQLNRQCSRDCP